MTSKGLPSAPTEREREWLLDELGRLVGRGGYLPLVGWPLVEPTNEFFPDAIDLTPSGVKQIADRIFAYSGLGHLQIRVQDMRQPVAPARAPVFPQSDVLVGSVSEGVVVLELHELGSLEDLTALLCYRAGQVFRDTKRIDAVESHPYRDRKGGESGDSGEEEDRAGVAALYLGFGILIANGAFRIQTATAAPGDQHGLIVCPVGVGTIPASATAYLMAVQCVVRRSSDSEIDGIEDHLRPDTAAEFRKWVRALEPDVEQLTERLGIPDPSSWLQGAVRPQLQESNAAGYSLVYTGEEEGAGDRLQKFNRGRRVSRVQPRNTAGSTILSTLFWGSAGLVSIPIGASVPVALGVAGITGLAGFLLSRRKPSAFCSDADCGCALVGSEVRCPRCGGDVIGEIDRVDKRLDYDE